MEEGTRVQVNKQFLSESEANKWLGYISNCSSFVNIQGNENESSAKNYWYDKRCGLWGWVGGPIQGIIEPNIQFIRNTCEGNWSVKWNIEKYEPTNVWVNGREVHPLDLDHFKRLRLPIKPVEPQEPAEFWIITADGEITPELDQSQGILKRQDSSIIQVFVEPSRWIQYNELNKETSKRQIFRNKWDSLKGDSTEGYYIHPINLLCGDTYIYTECKFNQISDFDSFVSFLLSFFV